jgi:hypothetical protein
MTDDRGTPTLWEELDVLHTRIRVALEDAEAQMAIVHALMSERMVLMQEIGKRWAAEESEWGGRGCGLA